MSQILDLTWVASLLCALGMSVIALEALKHKAAHFIVRDPLFLPLYFAGIIQWVVWGIRIGDVGLIYPSVIQLALLAPSLWRWYKVRAT